MTQVFASRLRGANVLTDRGLQIGKLQDMVVDEGTGKILNLIVRPVSREILQNMPKEGGDALIPFSSVMAMRDYIVVNERVLAIQQLKAPPVPEPGRPRIWSPPKV